MKTAFATGCLGGQIKDIDHLLYFLDAIKIAGYNGVEIGQHPSRIGGVNTHKQLVDLANRFDLRVSGYGLGTLTERSKFLGEIGHTVKGRRQELPYFCITDQAIDVGDSLSQGYRVAAHLHFDTRLRTERELDKYIQVHDELEIVADTAHLLLAGIDTCEFIARYFKRLAAVHLKEYSFDHGVAPFVFERGFRLLTDKLTSEVNAGEVVRLLSESNYNQWLVIEIDNRHYPPEVVILESANWLHEHGLIRDAPKSPNRTYAVKWAPSSYERDSKFLWKMLHAGSDYSHVPPDASWYRQLSIEVLNAFSPAALGVSIWSCNSKCREMHVLSSAFRENTDADSLVDDNDQQLSEPLGVRTLNIDTCLTGVAIERQDICTQFDLAAEFPGSQYDRPKAEFADKELCRKLGIRSLLSIPAFNPGNQNHIRFVINVYLRAPIQLDGTSYPSLNDVYRISRGAVLATNSLLEARRDAARRQASRLRYAKNFETFPVELIELLRRSVDAEGASIFIESALEPDRLEVMATSGLSWSGAGLDSQYYHREEDTITSRIWNRNEPLIIPDVEVVSRDYSAPRKSYETVVTTHRFSCLYVPVSDAFTARAVGVVRLRNKRRDDRQFSDDDIAVIQAICEELLSSENLWTLPPLEFLDEPTRVGRDHADMCVAPSITDPRCVSFLDMAHHATDLETHQTYLKKALESASRIAIVYVFWLAIGQIGSHASELLARSPNSKEIIGKLFETPQLLRESLSKVRTGPLAGPEKSHERRILENLIDDVESRNIASLISQLTYDMHVASASPSNTCSLVLTVKTPEIARALRERQTSLNEKRVFRVVLTSTMCVVEPNIHVFRGDIPNDSEAFEIKISNAESSDVVIFGHFFDEMVHVNSCQISYTLGTTS